MRTDILSSWRGELGHDPAVASQAKGPAGNVAAWPCPLVGSYANDLAFMAFRSPSLVATGLGGTAALGATWLMIGPPLLVFLASQRHFYRGIAPGPLL